MVSFDELVGVCEKSSLGSGYIASHLTEDACSLQRLEDIAGDLGFSVKYDLVDSRWLDEGYIAQDHTIRMSPKTKMPRQKEVLGHEIGHIAILANQFRGDDNIRNVEDYAWCLGRHLLLPDKTLSRINLDDTSNKDLIQFAEELEIPFNVLIKRVHHKTISRGYVLLERVKSNDGRHVRLNVTAHATPKNYGLIDGRRITSQGFHYAHEIYDNLFDRTDRAIEANESIMFNVKENKWQFRTIDVPCRYSMLNESKELNVFDEVHGKLYVINVKPLLVSFDISR